MGSLGLTEEHVLVITESRLNEVGAFSGFRAFNQAALDALLAPEHMQFRPRSAVEDDPSFKQLIPYAVLVHGTGPDRQVFQYTRGKGQGERRLHALKSIGIGGHISREDAQGSDPYRSGMQRELSEEMLIETTYREVLAGFIYDDTTAVGRVHLGVVHLIVLSQPSARARESELVDSGFSSLAELKRNAHQFETWSQLCLNNLFSD